MHVGAAVRRLAVLLLLGLAACEAPLDPIAESDLAYSFSGYLDASADTQWVRVEPFGRVNAPTPGPLDAVVSLVKPDGTVRPMTQEVRTFETGPAHLFWSTEDVVPAASYRIEVRGADGTMAVAPVDVPDDSALEIDLVDGLIHCPTVVRVSGAEFLVDVQARYVTPDGRPFRFSKAASFAVLNDGAIGASIYYGSDADAMDIDLLPDPAVSAEIVVAVGTDDWVSVGDLSLEAALALAGLGRIEGGVGFLGGVVTKRFPFVPGVGPFPPPYSGLPFVPCVPER